MSKDTIFDRVTQKIIADLEQGVRPWQKPWDSGKAIGRIIRPLRHNGEAYNGVNILLLWGAAIESGYQNPTWMTFKQAIDYGGHVRKGEKSSLVVYADKIVRTEENTTTGEDMEKVIPFLKGYSVFNVEQIEGLPEKFSFKPEPTPEGESIRRVEAIESFVGHTTAVIRHGGDRAYYAMHTDHVQMPPIEAFADAESYYSTLTHELTHWTKHPTRLDRSFGRKVWGDEGYAKEELVAELGSAFLCADLGITPETRADHAAYIDNWLQALKNDRKLIFTAASHASKAIEFLKNKQPSPECVVPIDIAAIATPATLQL